MGRLIRTILALSFLGSAFAHAADLAGRILDQKGAPLSGAIVTVNRSSVDGPLRTAESYMTTTRIDGTYSLKNLPAGPYVVCATAPTRDLLDPCRWNYTQTIIRIPPEGAAVPSTTQLQQGATIAIRVEDPDKMVPVPVLPPGTSGVTGTAALLVMGVWTPTGHHHEAWRTGNDNTGSDYQLIVPPDTDFQLAIDLVNLVLQDNAGKVVDTSKRPPIKLKAGQRQQFHYIVRKKP